MNRRLVSILAVTVSALFLGVSPPLAAEELLAIEALPEGRLEQSSGRQGVPFQWQINDTEQNAVVADNALSGQVVTGDNRISDNAFGNMQGIATVIQNTGNQVVIQDSTQINVLINQ